MTTTLEQFRAELATILGCEVARLPPVFQGPRPRVLAIGIFIALQRAFPCADKARLGDWLERYTASPAYLKRKARAHYRNDLQGNNVSRIEKASKARASRILAAIDPAGAQRATAAGRGQPTTEAAHAGR